MCLSLSLSRTVVNQKPLNFALFFVFDLCSMVTIIQTEQGSMTMNSPAADKLQQALESGSSVASTQSKEEINRAIASNLNVQRNLVDAVLQEYYNLAKLRLATMGRAKTPFGYLVLQQMSARPGRNPKTGEPVHIEARHRVKFRAGTVFLREVREIIEQD